MCIQCVYVHMSVQILSHVCAHTYVNQQFPTIHIRLDYSDNFCFGNLIKGVTCNRSHSEGLSIISIKRPFPSLNLAWTEDGCLFGKIVTQHFSHNAKLLQVSFSFNIEAAHFSEITKFLTFWHFCLKLIF